jgi:hypothetical protein
MESSFGPYRTSLAIKSLLEEFRSRSSEERKLYGQTFLGGGRPFLQCVVMMWKILCMLHVAGKNTLPVRFTCVLELKPKSIPILLPIRVSL